MNEKKHKIANYLFLSLGIVFFILLFSALAITQTTFGKNKIKELIITSAKEQNIDLSIEKLGSILPFKYTLYNVKIGSGPQEVTVENLYVQLAFWPIFFKNLQFDKIIAENITVASKEASQNDLTAQSKEAALPSWFSPSFSITFNSFDLKNIHLASTDSKIKDIEFNLQGNGKIRRNGDKINFHCKLQRKDFDQSSIEFLLEAIKPLNNVKIEAEIATNTLKVFAPIFETTIDSSLDINVSAGGTFSSIKDFLTKSNKPRSDIFGKVHGYFYNFQSQDKNLSKVFEKNTDFSADFKATKDLIELNNCSLVNNFFSAEGAFFFDQNLNFQNANFDFLSDLENFQTIMPSKLWGKLKSKTVLTKEDLNAEVEIENFHIDYIHLASFKTTLTAKNLMNELQGKLKAEAFAFNQPLSISTDFNLDANKNFQLPNFAFSSPSSSMQANLSINKDLIILGTGTLKFENLSQLQDFFPNLDLNAEGSVSLEFNAAPNQLQSLKIAANFLNFHATNVIGKSFQLNLDLTNPFVKPTGSMDLELNTLRFHKLELSSITFKTSNIEENNPFSLTLDGSWEGPLNIKAIGLWKKTKNEIALNLNNFSGDLFNYPFSMPKPLKAEFSKEKLLIDDLELNFMDSSLLAKLKIDSKSSDISIQAKHFPLNFLSLNPLDLNIKGYTTLNLSLEGKENLTGKIDATLEDVEIFSIKDESPLTLKGSILVSLKDTSLQTEASIIAKTSQNFKLSSNTPITINLWPFSLSLNQEKTMWADIDYTGKIEEILDFINIGAQHLEGDLSCKLKISQTLKEPNLQGICEFKNGTYENYFTGTYLQNIEAKILANNEQLDLEYLRAKDISDGKILATGTFSLSSKMNYPFSFYLDLDKLICVQTDSLQAKGSSRIELEGNRTSALAKGTLKIDEAVVNIPPSIPIVLPNVEINYINRPTPAILPLQKIRSPIYPLNLDLIVDAQNPITVQGQGVNSTWQGTFKVLGSYNDILATGSLNLIQGTYSFSLRKFELTQGSLSLIGKSHEVPFFNLHGKTTQQGIDILANLKGPINSLKLTFNSEPPLPASSIMSLLLFGKGISDITGEQTVELASKMTNNLDEESMQNENHPSTLGPDR
ncbi:MAG: translocation/assembly module TamB domain-containing protein, partial [Chlamydiae bacterium]|nr:translocation/assembly module TamB domain-containing protein [Chlamydiota bacterium]